MKSTDAAYAAPRDVRTAFLLHGTVTIAKPVVWYGFFLFVILYYVVFGKYEVRLTNLLIYPATAVILLFPFFMGWIADARRVGRFTGRITELHRSRTIVTDYMARKRGADRQHQLILTFTITDENGKKHLLPVRDPRFADINYFSVGDEVLHRWGAKFPEKLRKDDDPDVLCLVCGSMCRMDFEICPDCRHTLCKRSYGRYAGM